MRDSTEPTRIPRARYEWLARQADVWRDTPHGAVVFVPLIGPGGFPDDDADALRRRRRWF